MNNLFDIMMEIEEAKMIKDYLNPRGIMLEYGVGGSTLYFSKFVGKYYGIEHTKNWYNSILPLCPENCQIVLAETIFPGIPNLDSTIWKYFTPEERNNWDSLCTGKYFKLFENYVTYPSRLNQKFYDFVLIDGRARPECAKFIYDYLHDDSLIFIHDFYKESYDDGKHLRIGGREHYHMVLEKYDIIDSTETLVVLRKRKNT